MSDDTRIVAFLDKNIRVGGSSLAEYVQYLKDNDEVAEPEKVFGILESQRKAKEVKLTQLKLEKSLRTECHELTQIVASYNRVETQKERDNTWLNLSIVKSKKDDLVSRFVKLKDDKEAMQARQASEYLIDNQIEQQKQNESRGEEVDPEKERLKDELKRCKETVASIEQELKAKYRSLRRLEGML